jgi:hypothetical protein
MINNGIESKEHSVNFGKARDEYNKNKKTIQSCVTKRIFRNGEDTKVRISEIDGGWIILD